MSALNDAQLKGQVLAILRSDKALEKINFKVGQFLIGTMHYQILAAYLDIGRLHCKVDPSNIPQNAAAVYDPGSNTILAKESRLQYIDEKETLVHEATHALIDLVGGLNKGTKVTSLETETCAYIAGAMYSIAIMQSQQSSGVKTTVYSKDKDIKAAADSLVRGKGLGLGSTNAGSPITFLPQDIAALQRCDQGQSAVQQLELADTHRRNIEIRVLSPSSFVGSNDNRESSDAARMPLPPGVESLGNAPSWLFSTSLASASATSASASACSRNVVRGRACESRQVARVVAVAFLEGQPSVAAGQPLGARAHRFDRALSPPRGRRQGLHRVGGWRHDEVARTSVRTIMSVVSRRLEIWKCV
jgi:hypothetical protein